MRKTKILALILAILMLTGSATLFSSCKKDDGGIVSLSKKTVELALGDYALLYGDSQSGSEYTATFRDYLKHFATRLSLRTGKKVSALTMNNARTGAGDKEILVGNTGRAESTEALGKIKGEGFIIQVTDNKVVIVGTTNLLTLMAANYFVENYLPDGEVAETTTVNVTAKAEELATLTLATTEAAEYAYVYSATLAQLPPVYVSSSSPSTTPNYEEYPQVAATQIQEKMVALTGVNKKKFPIGNDKETIDKEVLIGMTAREESSKVLENLDANKYVVATIGERVVINAWNEAMLQKAAAAYLDFLTEGTVFTDGKKGNVVIPSGFNFVTTGNTDWVLDFPRPEGEGINLKNTMDANDNALQFLYTGEGVNADSYKEYCDKLKENGYKVYTESTIEGSYFTTFVNDEEKVSLYVAYNAYSHVEEYKGKYDWVLSKKMTKDPDCYVYDACFRIVSAPLDSAYLPDKSLLTPQTYTKVTDSAITTMPIYGTAVGLCYIITLEDGRFVVFDGGGVGGNGALDNEHEILWNTLSALHQDNTGSAPSAGSPIRIAAWILTHAHWDHYYAFQNLCKQYGSQNLLKMDYMIANVPAVTSAYPVQSIAATMTPEHVANLQKSVKGGFEYIKVHTGWKFYLANLEIEVLTTWEDLNPLVPNNTNDTNTVVRFTMSNKDGGTPITQLWTGDANRWQSRYLCAMFGSYLESDMVSIGHHGNAGLEIDLYETVKPTTVWWPHNEGSVRSYLLKDAKYDFRNEVDQHLCNNIDSVHYVFTTGSKTKGSSYLESFPYTTLRFGVDGPDYDNIYDVMMAIREGSRAAAKVAYTDITAGTTEYTISACMRK